MSILVRRIALFLMATCWVSMPVADDAVPIKTVSVTENIAMLMGRGGNVAVSSGADGVFVIDDQYATQYEVIKAAIAAISPDPVKFLINTHWHSDHAGGNELMSKAGAIIVAHKNVRQRLSADQLIEFFKAERPASPAAALPVVTFSADLTFHLNGDEVHVFHVSDAHTDGDAVVHFKTANVIHTGDVFFHQLYPFIDASSGGSIGGMITAAERILAVADDATQIIPGHGTLTNKQGLADFRDMLKTTYNAIATLMVAGNDVEKIVAAQPTAAFDVQWGDGFLKPEVFVRMMVDSITRSTIK
jgi:cyclase